MIKSHHKIKYKNKWRGINVSHYFIHSIHYFLFEQLIKFNSFLSIIKP